MNREIQNIYCDESCHLLRDKGAMALGAIAVSERSAYRHNSAIREIKKRHGMSEHRELKWTKVSPAQIEVYEELLNYFFEQPDLSFRAVIVPDKSMAVIQTVRSGFTEPTAPVNLSAPTR